MNMNLKNQLKKELPTPKEERDKVKQIAIKALAGFLIIMVAFTGLSKSADALTTPQVVAQRPKGGRIEQKVEVRGSLKPKNEESMEVGEGLLVKNVFVEAGQRVKKGDVLLELDAKEIKEKLDTARDDLKKLQLRLEQLSLNKDFTANSSPMETAKKTLADLEEDKINLVKKEDVKIERAKEKVKEAEEDLKEAEENLATFQGESLEEQLKKAKEEEKEAQKHLETQKYEKDKAIKRAQQTVDEAKENLWLLGGGEATSALQALERAEMEYEITKSDWERTIKAAEESLQKAKDKVKRLENGEIDDESLKQEEEKVKAARNQVKEQERLLEDTLVSKEDTIADLNRKIESAKKDLVKAEGEEENLALSKEQNLQKEGIEKELMLLDIEAKEREISKLEKAIKEGGQLKAPSSGIIRKVKVTKGDTTTKGDLLVFVGDTSSYILETELTKEEAELIKIGDQVEVTLDGDKMPVGDSIVESIVPVQGDTEGKKKISISVPKGEPGMGAMMKVIQESDKYRYIIPIEALREENGSYYVLVAKQQTTTLGEEIIADRVDIMILDKNQRSAAVEGALGAQDTVIVKSNKPISAGDRVRLVEQ
ncbi:MAG: HlyD family efflux transporter periplasmic adaptor subunit [Clostridiales bacterium]|nr:HlyD family efflux transporter periplasmic adaptor subunit [Clostridiales bacterium]